jgi:hypothetical protein
MGKLILFIDRTGGTNTFFLMVNYTACSYDREAKARIFVSLDIARASLTFAILYDIGHLFCVFFLAHIFYTKIIITTYFSHFSTLPFVYLKVYHLKKKMQLGAKEI